jgi:amino acid transporter
LQAVPWLAVTSLAVTSAVVAAIVLATGQWLLLVSVGAAIEAGIYALVSLCILLLRKRERRERPFRLIAARPLATIGVVLFSVMFVATAFANPKNASHFSIAPFVVIAVLGALSTTYVLTTVPRLQREAAARASATRTKRRPTRVTTASDVESS